MRPSTIFVRLLGFYDLVLASDLAAIESDVWCVTYLSTYLMPVSSSIAFSTDINSASTAISSTASNSSTTEPSSLEIKTTEAHSRSQQTSKLSSTLTTTDQLNSSQIQTLSSTTLSTTDLFTSSIIPTSSTTASTDVTTTSTPQPSSRSIILGIQPPITNRRRNIKRAPLGGFVGGTQVCTFALDFTLSVEGQLLAGGVPVFYAGEDFKPISEQKPISNSGDIITKTFAESNGVLVFKNSSLPSGEAGFCQTSTGVVYITFSSQPSGCVPVALRIYEVRQCQNGRIIDGSTTSSFATSTSEAASSRTPTSTTTIQSEPTGPSSESTESREPTTSTMISSTSSSSTSTTRLSATVSSDLSSEGTPSTTLESTSEISSIVTGTTILTNTENATSDDISSIQSSTETPTSSATAGENTSTGDTAALSTISSKSSTISTSSTTTSAAPSLVQDGGFEDNPNTAWTLSGNAAIVNDPSIAHTGHQYLQMSVNNGMTSDKASQTGLVSSPTTMRLSFVVMASPKPSGPVNQCSFRVKAGGSLVAAYLTNTPLGVWQTRTFNVGGSGSSWTIELYLYCSGGSATLAIGVDDAWGRVGTVSNSTLRISLCHDCADALRFLPAVYG
ncbi:hypothetical protein FCOIX_8233 [Fusarium coicis]|nr:hypothetical protein FCOIX_8233 [Fusarium coicis]